MCASEFKTVFSRMYVVCPLLVSSLVCDGCGLVQRAPVYRLGGSHLRTGDLARQAMYLHRMQQQSVDETVRGEH